MPLYFVCDQNLSRRPHLDQISIWIIEPDNLLSPAVCHKLVHVLDPRIQPFQFFSMNASRSHSLKYSSVGLFRKITFVLKDKSLCQDYIATIIQHYLQSKQIMVKLLWPFDILYPSTSLQDPPLIQFNYGVISYQVFPPSVVRYTFVSFTYVNSLMEPPSPYV